MIKSFSYRSITDAQLADVRRRAKEATGFEYDIELVNDEPQKEISSGDRSQNLTQTKLNFSLSSHEKARAATRKLFFACGLPFSLAKSTYFKNFVDAVAAAGRGVSIPGYEEMRTLMLNEEKKEIREKVAELLVSSRETGLSIATDGWENIARKPIINCMIISPQGEIFHDSLHTKFHTKTGK